MYRVSLGSQESGWLLMIDDECQDRAPRTQMIVEMKPHNLACLMCVLGAPSGILLLGILGFWVYKGIPALPPECWLASRTAGSVPYGGRRRESLAG